MQQFKFRYVNQIVGTFVILVVFALLVGIFLAGQAQQWFVTTHRYNLEFPPEGSLGIQENSQVVILGAVVGSVEKLSVDPEGEMTGRIAVKGDFYRFIREDSKAIVKKKFVVAGDSFIEITRGTGRLLEAEETLVCEKDTEITEYLEIALENFQEALLPVADQAQELLGNLNLIAAGLAEGEGAAGAVLRDPELAARIKKTVARLEEISRDAARAVSSLPPMAETMAEEVEDIPGLVVQSREMLRESQRLVEALQNHWLIRGSVDRVEESARIPASEVTVP